MYICTVSTVWTTIWPLGEVTWDGGLKLNLLCNFFLYFITVQVQSPIFAKHKLFLQVNTHILPETIRACCQKCVFMICLKYSIGAVYCAWWSPIYPLNPYPLQFHNPLFLGHSGKIQLSSTVGESCIQGTLHTITYIEKFCFLYIFSEFCVYVPLPPLRGQHTVLCHPRWLPTSELTEFAVCWGGAGFEPKTTELKYFPSK